MPKLQTTDPWHAHNTCEHIPNKETLEAFAETEEIIRQIRAGDRTGCMTLEEFLAEMHSWLEEDSEDD